MPPMMSSRAEDAVEHDGAGIEETGKTGSVGVGLAQKLLELGNFLQLRMDRSAHGTGSEAHDDEEAILSRRFPF